MSTSTNNSQSTLTLDVAAASHIGLLRSSNQDVALAYLSPENPTRALLLVADGMGGHLAGHLASQLAAQTLLEHLQPFLDGLHDGNSSLSPAERLKQAVEHANRVIRQYAAGHPDEAGDMGSTLTCALFDNGLVIIANVGDSRAYHLSQGTLHQVSQDHSLVAELIREGELPAEALFFHPQRNIITRALGAEEHVEVDIWVRPIASGDWILLCSDGLWEMVPEPLIAHILFTSVEANLAVGRLIETANERGGYDNIGVAVARVW